MSQRTNPKVPLRRTSSRADVVTAARVLARTASRPSRPSNNLRPRAAPGYLDTALTSYNCSTTGTIALLNAVPQGSGTSQRVGKRIRLKSLQMLGSLQAGTTGFIADATVFLIYDRRPDAALPAITDILVAVTSNSFLNDNNSNRFRVIRRMDYTLNGNLGSFPTSQSSLDMTNFIKFPPKYNRTSYKALGTGAIADIDEGAIYCLSVGGNAAGTAAPIAQLTFRLRYYDEQG